MTKKSAFNQFLSKKIIITALAFGAAGWLVLSVGLFIPVIGTEVNTDPHELFVTLGAALTGPVGAAMVALIADSARPQTATKPIAIIGHVLGGLWMGFVYKTLVYQRLKMPLLLAGWVGLVLVYYYLILYPFIFVFAAFGALPPEMSQLWPIMPWQLYFMAAKIGAPEALMTIIITTIVIAALPPKYRRPLW